MSEGEGSKGKAARTFEELHVYQRARELTNAVYAATRTGAWSQDWGLADQVRRAAVSIMSNIAEGFERGSSTEFIQFLYVAKGSAGEVRAQLEVARDQGYLAEAEHMRLRGHTRQVSAMLSHFIEHLQGSDYSGEKFVRPRRKLLEAQQQRLEALRQAQLVNERASHSSHSSDPSNPAPAGPAASEGEKV